MHKKIRLSQCTELKRRTRRRNKCNTYKKDIVDKDGDNGERRKSAMINKTANDDFTDVCPWPVHGLRSAAMRPRVT